MGSEHGSGQIPNESMTCEARVRIIGANDSTAMHCLRRSRSTRPSERGARPGLQERIETR